MEKEVINNVAWFKQIKMYKRFTSEDLKLKTPFTCLVAGPQGSGKTVLIRNLLKNYNYLIDITTKQLRVLWCYGVWQHLYTEDIASDVTIDYVNGFVTEEDIDNEKPHIIVIDDLMTELGGDKRLTNLFTKISHHKNVNVIFIVQNLFYQGKEMRNISLNSNYIFLLKNPRDKMQIISLGKQLFPGKAKVFEKAYNQATIKPFGYLLIDCKAYTPQELVLRTNIFPNENINDFAQTVFKI